MHAYLVFLCERGRFAKCMAFYARQKFRWLRMQSYSAGQRWWIYVQDKIYRVLHNAGKVAFARDPECSLAQLRLLEHPRKRPSHVFKRHRDPLCPDRWVEQPFNPPRAPAPRLCIVLGDGSFQHNSVGHITMPTGSRMLRELRRLGEYIRWVDEFRTSKRCAECGNDLQPAIVTRSHPTARSNPARIAKAAAGLALKQTRIALATAHDPSFPHADAPQHERYHAPLPKIEAHTLLARCPAGDSDLASTHPSDTLRAPWGLKVCTSATCINHLVCRDGGAARNMHLAVRWHLLGQINRLRANVEDWPCLPLPPPLPPSSPSPAIQANLSGH